ncbi:MAG: hypothetical protein ABIP94_20770 [Planctomycetota bacterium]
MIGRERGDQVIDVELYDVSSTPDPLEDPAKAQPQRVQALFRGLSR